jgi:hypothetical protein
MSKKIARFIDTYKRCNRDYYFRYFDEAIFILYSGMFNET